jgi:tripartite-type tricarboxylate transporter receptor subunit TctC
VRNFFVGLALNVAVSLSAWCGIQFFFISSDAVAQTWPSRPVRIVVPFPPGGAVDALARVVAQQFTENIGQPFVVENRAGASGIIGGEFVAKANPDGYVLLVQATTLVSTPLFVKNVPYDPQRDFTPISFLGIVANVMVVNNALPVNNLGELMNYLRNNPNKLSFGGPPIGSPGHLMLEAMRTEAKLDYQIITYKGTAPMVTDLLAGHVSAGADAMPTLVPHIRAGKLRALGVSSAKRSSSLPDTPTIAEAGLPGFDLVSWYGLWAPAKLPEEIASKLASQATRAVRSSMASERLGTLGFEAGGSTPAQFSAFIKEELVKLTKIVKTAGIQPE